MAGAAMRSIVWLALAAATALVVLAVVGAMRSMAPEPQASVNEAAANSPVAAPVAADANATPAPLPPPSFDIVRIDPQGAAVIAGRAAAGDRVRIIADGKPIGETTADANGEWVFLPQSPLAAGDLLLTLEAIGRDGGPVRRSQDKVALSVIAPTGTHAQSSVAVLLPGDTGAPTRVLQAAHPAVPDSAAAGGARPTTAPANAGTTWLVQRGNSLWLIARNLYGTGDRYNAIYAANRARIRNPDLIYPGQQFAVPKP
jgi:nucleoid-associated protein YgaU